MESLQFSSSIGYNLNMQYSNFVLSHFFNPSNIGEVSPDSHAQVVQYRQSQHHSSGDWVNLSLGFSKSHHISEAKFQANGNPYLIAGASLLCRELLVNSLENSNRFDFHYFVDKLTIPATKIYVAIMLEEVVANCIRQLNFDEVVNEH